MAVGGGDVRVTEPLADRHQVDPRVHWSVRPRRAAACASAGPLRRVRGGGIATRACLCRVYRTPMRVRGWPLQLRNSGSGAAVEPTASLNLACGVCTVSGYDGHQRHWSSIPFLHSNIGELGSVHDLVYCASNKFKFERHPPRPPSRAGSSPEFWPHPLSSGMASALRCALPCTPRWPASTAAHYGNPRPGRTPA